MGDPESPNTSRGYGASLPTADIPARAAELADRKVARSDLAPSFWRSWSKDVEVFVDGPHFYPRLLEDLEAADTSIHINQFGFKDGEVGRQFADVLSRKAKDGVAVRVIVDQAGTNPTGISADFYRGLVAAGVEVVESQGILPVARRGVLGRPRVLVSNVGGIGTIDHRKLFVVDGKTGWVGGAGIEDHFADGRFLDIFTRFEGEAAWQLQYVFLSSFAFLGGTYPADSDALAGHFPKPGRKPARAVPTVVLHNAPGPYRPITDAIAAQIGSAVESLDAVNPYAAHQGTLRRLIKAARRGVRVRLVCPAEPNNWAAASAQRYRHGDLLDAGVEIHEHPQMVHAKGLVADGRIFNVGTCNFESWGYHRFYEINVCYWSDAVATQAREKFFEPAVEASRPGTVDTHHFHRARNAFFKAISPLL